MIVTTLIYVLAFLLSVYIIWLIGRSEYLKEEKLIDLALISSLVGFSGSRIAYFLTPEGQSMFEAILKIPNTFWLIIEMFNLRSGMLWEFGFILYLSTAFLLLLRWQWPYWPMMGVMVLGASIFIICTEVLLVYERPFTNDGLLLAGFTIVGGVFVYIYKLKGIEILKYIQQKVKKNIATKLTKRLPK